MESFIHDADLIEEKVSENDLLDFGAQIDTFSNKVDTFTSSGLIGLVAEFGKGKSTLIHQVQKSRDGRDELWIEFEAWKLPDRRELWEGFVLELARQIDEECFDTARKQIDGETNADKKALVNTIGDIPGLAAIKNLNHFFQTSPARRVFEIQKILTDLIHDKVKANTLVIVTEDVDRSGPNGIYFLETLKQFVKTLDCGKQVIVIVPIAETSFLDNQESYLKCLDVIDFLDTSNNSLKNFFQQILHQDIVSSKIHQVEQVSTFFETVTLSHPDTTLRKIKLILRKALINYKSASKAGFEPDWRMSVLFETMKYFKDNTSDLSHFELMKKEKMVSVGTIYSSWLAVIYIESKNQPANPNLSDRENRIHQSTCNFTYATRKDNTPDGIKQFPSTPWFPQFQRLEEGERERGYFADFYLRY
jgi:hypothetical protein